ncbi:hypothetical protein [Micromonospora chalcea]|uniref:hypothetical protein n=1 Tax=Micromonospora chalcea TaxID=1874 RepID=UPI001656FD76|nr:hypothetical protein [Micromonospora chalcea]MBC8991780.1 hypothetical protein [Micromonospora chalcea]MCT2279778.1 hypothetical protein [Micromonospora chalcea]
MTSPTPTGPATVAGSSCAATFRCGNASVTLHTDDAQTLGEARRVLYSYEEQPAGPATWHIYLALDPDVVSSAEATTDGRRFDIGPQSYAYQRGPGPSSTFWVPDRGTLLHADHAARTIGVRCATAEAAGLWAPRLVRQAMTGQLLAEGMVYAHAAAFTCRERGILIAGHRGRGKTTTLLAGLHHLGGDYVTNDRLMLHTNDAGLHGYPWPMPLRAGIGTLAALPHLRHRVPAGQRALTTDEKWTFPHKIAIEPDDFADLLQRGGMVASQMTPSVMIWPHLDPRRTGVSVERVGSDEVHQTLLDTRMFMHDPTCGTSAHINQWLVPGPADEVTVAHLQRTAAALATLPCYRIHAGADPAALAAAVGALLDAGEYR